uniref:hypothetical protein n=1 Tax=Salmonella enterica TaxID=28901 RepID=UPI001C37F7C4
MPAFEWVHVQLHQQKGMISLSPPTICNSAVRSVHDRFARNPLLSVHQPDALHPEDVSIYAHSRLSFCHPILLHRFCCIDTVTGFVTAGERFIV